MRKFLLFQIAIAWIVHPKTYLSIGIVDYLARQQSHLIFFIHWTFVNNPFLRPTLKPFLIWKTNDRKHSDSKPFFRRNTQPSSIYTPPSKNLHNLTKTHNRASCTPPSLQNKTPLRESTILVRALIYVFTKSTDTVCVIFHCESCHIGKIN